MDGEATVVRRQPEELPRKDAQDRVFGERRRSIVTVEQLRGVTSTCIEADVNVANQGTREHAERLAAARRAHEQRVAAFERTHADWFTKQQACPLPKGHDGVQIKLPLDDDDITKLIKSFTCS